MFWVLSRNLAVARKTSSKMRTNHINYLWPLSSICDRDRGIRIDSISLQVGKSERFQRAHFHGGASLAIGACFRKARSGTCSPESHSSKRHAGTYTSGTKLLCLTCQVHPSVDDFACQGSIHRIFVPVIIEAENLAASCPIFSRIPLHLIEHNI